MGYSGIIEELMVESIGVWRCKYIRGEIIFWTEQGGCMYELTTVVTLSIKVDHTQARSIASMKNTQYSIPRHDAMINYWVLGEGETIFSKIVNIGMAVILQ